MYTFILFGLFAGRTLNGVRRLVVVVIVVVIVVIFVVFFHILYSSGLGL
jgi:hypothetical protein